MRISPPLRIAGVYVLVAAIWIWCSDRAVDVLVADAGLRMALQTFKGWIFVLATGVLLYWMIRRDVRRLQLGNRRLRVGREQALRVLVTAMDVRHQETGHHSERVARMATELGRLDGVHGLLDLGVEVLHPQRGPGEAAVAQRRHLLSCEASRIDFDA